MKERGERRGRRRDPVGKCEASGVTTLQLGDKRLPRKAYAGISNGKMPYLRADQSSITIKAAREGGMPQHFLGDRSADDSCFQAHACPSFKFPLSRKIRLEKKLPDEFEGPRFKPSTALLATKLAEHVAIARKVLRVA